MAALGRSLSTRITKKTDGGEPSGKPAAASRWPGPSNITTFLRVLRLLNLDRLKDWPGITEASFSARASTQNLQQHIKGTEWALYRLFEIWNPHETQDKLKPFFPPMAPLQSKNLRAALFRVLSDLKRDGVLGKEITLRKTMLDECKGDKFEEVLGSFSMSVLRKVSRKSGISDDYISKLAVTPSSRLSVTDQELLLPAILAHHYSLKQMVSEIKGIRKSYAEQNDAISQVQDSISAAKKELKTQRETVLSISSAEEKEAKELASLFEASWQGDPRWVQEILESTNMTSLNNDLLRESHLEDEPKAESPSLLKDLENRVSAQRSRLHSWQEFQRSLDSRLEATKPSQPIPKARSQGEPLFTKHQALTIASITVTSDIQAADLPPSSEEYLDLSSSLQRDIAAIKTSKLRKTKPPIASIPKANKPVANKPATNKPVASKPAVSTKPIQKQLDMDLSFNDLILNHPPLPRNRSSTVVSTNSKSSNPSPPIIDEDAQVDEQIPQPEPEPIKELDIDDTPESLDTTSSSLDVASPEPPEPLDDQHEHPTESNDDTQENETLEDISSPTPAAPRTELPNLPTRMPLETLLERTRQSMSLVPNAPSSTSSTSSNSTSSSSSSNNNNNQRPRMQKRHSQPRPSYPVNPFNTPPPKSRLSTVLQPSDLPSTPTISIDDTSISSPGLPSLGPRSTAPTFAAINSNLSPRSPPSPGVDLFSDDATYESVFKSRPKIRNSPDFSPDRSAWWGGGAGDDEEEDI